MAIDPSTGARGIERSAALVSQEREHPPYVVCDVWRYILARTRQPLTFQAE